VNIIAGIVKGRKLEIPKGIRPTAQKVKEALFNIQKGFVLLPRR